MADWIASPLVGISQIFVVESAISGAIILAGIAVYSRECAAHTLLGSSIGIVTGCVLGADPSALTAVRAIQFDMRKSCFCLTIVMVGLVEFQSSLDVLGY